jgi:hypothetical protein
MAKKAIDKEYFEKLLQTYINYYEDKCEKHKEYIAGSELDDAYMEGWEEGMRDAYYKIQRLLKEESK